MKRRIIILFSSALFCVLSAIVLMLVKSSICQAFDQTVAERWSTEGKSFTQMSVFISENAAVGSHTIEEIRNTVGERLLSESVTSEGARGFFDAYSSRSTATLSRDKKSVQSTAYFTGGDFFRFHSLDITSGWYYNEYDLMDDGVLINTYAAWQLYGSFDIVGKPIEVSGYPCIVYGVFDDSGENANLEPVVYASYSLLYKMGEKSPAVTCYEIVVPNPVKNFGENIVREAVKLDERVAEILKNSGRYGFLKNAKEIRTFLSRTDRNNAVIYPSWENRARRTESLAIILTLFVLVLLVYPVLVFLAFMILLYAKKKTLAKYIIKSLKGLSKIKR